MRVKTDQRRQAIMEAASAIFREIGFERTSMSAIASRVGGSKATLYSYFKSKEELFSAIMREAMADRADRMIALLSDSTEDLRTTLMAFGHAYLDLVLSEDALGFVRIGIMDSAHGDLGPLLYATGPEFGWNLVAQHLARWSDEGRLKIADAKLAALQLKGLLEAGLFEPRLFGAPIAVDREASLLSAVDIFLLAYSTPRVPEPLLKPM